MDKPKNKNPYLLIFALMAGYSMIYMDKNMISTAIIPLADEFSLTNSQTGLIMSLFFLGYSMMQIPSGWLADKFGAKKVLMTSLALVSLFSIFFGIGASLIAFVAIRFFAGVGHAGYPPSCSKTIADHFPKEKRTFVQSLILSTSGIGGILAFTLGAQLIASNWKLGYYVLGALFAVAMLCVFFFVPKEYKAPGQMNNNAPKLKFTEIITNRDVLILFVAMLLLNFLLYGNISWLPTYLKSQFGIGIGQVGTILAINAVCTTVATMIVGGLLSKWFLGKEKAFVISTAILVSLLLVGFIFSTKLIVSAILLVLISMVSVGTFTAIFTWPHKLFDQAIIGSSIGIINTGGTIGGFLAPMILGALIDKSGGSFGPAFAFMAIAALLCGLTTLLLRTRKQSA
ncbi:MFS transporter [Paenibacillus thiaminolyticus]|uniref:MFS transporter n=1 Tax=Paenibacillus thiaminolyticus TaxID=49283 RepID=A0A3A3GJZ3_PANTH|nr:MFS transporter [Paenibacillus thiaminolyticus]RJG23990.1 MFS transporter [Paenibacillus thiaminolyticus]